MRKAGAIFLALLIGLVIPLAAQSEDPPDEGEWDYYNDLYTRGDQTFIISLGSVFPAIFRGNGKAMDRKFSPPIGGTGSLAYNYYLSKEFFVGAELSGMFIRTLGSNTLFAIPLGARGGYQFNYHKFEFPFAATFGVVWQRYLNQGYFGIYTKIGGSAYYKATSHWSFGVNADWIWFPQWTGNKAENAHGTFVDLTLSARYHF